jgi:outer membrane PBP1 activator LpoA protein
MFGCDLFNSGFQTRGSRWPISLITTIASALLLSSCASGPVNLPVEQPVIVETATPDPASAAEPEPIVHGLEQDADIVVLDDPWELVQEANAAPAYEVPRLLIRAINEFLDREQVQTAQTITRQLESYPLTPDERLSLTIIQSRIAVRTGSPGLALNMMDNINLEQVRDTEIRRQVLTIKSEAQTALGRKSDATASLLMLDPLLVDQERVTNQQQILQKLQSMDTLHLSLLEEKYSAPDLQGWVALADTLNSTTPDFLQADVQVWRGIYPTHPLIDAVLQRASGTVQLNQYRQIALLLPLTSAYGNAAKAFYDGFVEAQLRDSSFPKPEIILYDVGEEPGLSSLYYQAAINDGADFVVGPLGRDAAESLMINLVSETDTLIIAEISPGKEAGNLYGISLSPEAEARQVAEKAWADGHRQATVLRIGNPWGQRVGAAFVAHWESLGGVVVRNNSFPAEVSDYSRVIGKFLGLDKSAGRHRLIQARSGLNLKFTPRRYEDMDFLFLAASSKYARLVVPQLRFFQAHDLPLYATSYVYSGKPEPGVDADLDGLVFGEMKWMLDGVELYKEKVAEEAALKAEARAAREAEEAAAAALEASGTENMTLEQIALAEQADGQTGEQGAGESGAVDGEISEEQNPVILNAQGDDSIVTNLNGDTLEDGMLNDDLSGDSVIPATPKRPYQGTSLDKLYALGLQSYPLIPRLAGLRASKWSRFTGEAITLSVNESGAVIQHPVWSKFSAGLPQPLPPYKTASPDQAIQ